jgi:hypothetical protein
MNSKQMHMNMRIVAVIEHQTKKKHNLSKSIDINLLNMNPERYIIEGYCLKYPTDPGDQNINEEDVVRGPQNHKCSDYEESRNGNSSAPLVSQHMEHVNSAGQVDQPTNNVQTAPCMNIE